MESQTRYQKFYAQILAQIKSGELKNGEKLPTERALCDLYNISRTTVREAFKNLEHDGYIIRKQGSGNFVNIKPIQQNLRKLYTLREMFDKQGIKHEVQLLKFEIAPCAAGIADRLNQEAGDPVVEIFRLFLAADVPYSIEYTYLPGDIFKDIARDMVANDGLYNTLERLGHKPTSATESIRVTKMDNEQRELLRLSKIEFCHRDRPRHKITDDAVIEYTKNIIRNQYFVYTVELK